jgi:hypothetical protein
MPYSRILDKWREFGYEFAEKTLNTSYKRFESSAQAGTSKETTCSMCDGKIDPKTAVSVNTAKGVHILYSDIKQAGCFPVCSKRIKALLAHCDSLSIMGSDECLIPRPSKLSGNEVTNFRISSRTRR